MKLAPIKHNITTHKNSNYNRTNKTIIKTTRQNISFGSSEETLSKINSDINTISNSYKFKTEMNLLRKKSLENRVSYNDFIVASMLAYNKLAVNFPIKEDFFGKGKTIEDKYWEIFDKEQEEVRYIKENKTFFTNVISQSQALLEYLDKEIEKIIGVSIDMVPGQTQTNRKVTYPTYTPYQVPTTKNKNVPIDTPIRPTPPKAALPTLDEFQKLEKEDMPALVSKFAKGTKEEKQSLLNLYTTLDKKHASLPEESPERLSLGRKLYVLEKQMIEGNISFIPKAPSSFATEADKIKYIKSALHYANTNEASAMDALSVFEKYGSRYEYGSFKAININHGLYDLTIAVERVADKLDAATTDKVINQYLDIFNKYARIDGEYADTRLLLRMIEKNNDKMSENTVSKIIETLKKFSFEKSQTWSVRKYIVSNEFSKRSPEELARLDVKLKELEEIVKDMPMKNKAKPGA